MDCLLQAPLAQDSDQAVQRGGKTSIYRGEFIKDFHLYVAVSQMHDHKDTFFKHGGRGVSLVLVGLDLSV